MFSVNMHKTFCTFALFAISVLPPAYPVSVGKDLTLTFSEKQVLDKFRRRVAPQLKYDYMKLDIYLVRWLRARDFNLDSAELMLKQTLNWRKEQNVDNILNEDFSDVFSEFPTSTDTYDKEGRPISVFDAADFNISRAVTEGRAERLLRFVIYNLENLTQQVINQFASGRNVSQWVLLANAECFNYKDHLCLPCLLFWLQVAEIIDHHYHGWLDEFIIVQATPAVHTLLDIVRPFLSRQFQQTLKIFGSNRTEWMKYLDKRISRSERYPRYGGTKSSNI